MREGLLAYRVRAQMVTAGTARGDGAFVVGRLGGVQAQLHDMSLWALSRRSGRTRAQLAAEFDAGAFVRTHVLRPTWHHVLAADLPDLLALTADRVRRTLDTAARTAGLPPATRHAAADVVAEAVRAHGPLTRAEVAAHLTAAGLDGPGGRWATQPLAHVLIEAELRGAVGSGPMRGKQHTYRALDLPPSRRADDERLAWLARRYVCGHGPARPEDLAWWASLPVTAARRAFALAALRPVTLAGVELFVDDDAAPDASPVPAAMLLSNYDELISYRRDPGDWGPYATDAVLRAQGLVLVDGALVGLWTRAETTRGVVVTVSTPVSLSARARAGLEAEAERYGRFAGLPATLTIA
ncbi:winged helix DNA-binding domain-containing protein [Xylanimonas ulmi]|uniref:Winged helix DNA-binding protein n=1 Tax=Xylanimonas ulmi TaxID=228973 RepID=A0A4Q7M561_9MICO|nr:winged helix DNA-binding domain-containing protein [Xylanibacterium ulmi]RZS61149.1 winged helix DNA-binding protein [Xylanibacterium ulmi]